MTHQLELQQQPAARVRGREGVGRQEVGGWGWGCQSLTAETVSGFGQAGSIPGMCTVHMCEEGTEGCQRAGVMLSVLP
jgi:hypothetical protein